MKQGNVGSIIIKQLSLVSIFVFINFYCFYFLLCSFHGMMIHFLITLVYIRDLSILSMQLTVPGLI